jgi:putative sporulation protein YtxC
MQFLSIEVINSSENIADYILDEVNKSNFNKLKYMINKIDTTSGVSITIYLDNNISFTNNENIYKQLTTCISTALADYIISEHEGRLIDKIINSNYCYFNSIERKELFFLTKNIIKNPSNSLINSIYPFRRKNLIVKKLHDYFEYSNSIILDGFINFRLKDYLNDLEEIVDKAVDDFLMEREYKEFIRLLKYFVDIQIPKFELINIFTDYDGKYLLLDMKNVEIPNEYMQESLEDISDGELNNDDMLVSSLITLAPKKIIIHEIERFNNKELIETIKNVFSGRFFICEDCNMCKINLVKN